MRLRLHYRLRTATLFVPLLASLNIGAAAQSEPNPAQSPAVKANPAEGRAMRDMYFGQDRGRMSQFGKQIATRKGASLEARAWFIAGISYSDPFPALLALESMRKDDDQSPWTFASRALFATNVEEAVALCEKAAAKSTNDDILWLCADSVAERISKKEDADLLNAFVNHHASKFDNSAEGLAVRGDIATITAMRVSQSMFSDDAAALYERALKLDSGNLTALSGRLMERFRRHQYREAAGVFLQAPPALRNEDLHIFYWTILDKLDSISKEEQEQRMVADIREVLNRQEPSSECVMRVDQALQKRASVRKEMLGVIAQKFPNTEASEMAEVMLATTVLGADGELESAAKETKAQLAKSLLAFLGKPNRKSDDAEDRAEGYLSELAKEPEMADDEILAAIRGLQLTADNPYSFGSAPQLVIALANRKADLHELEQFTSARVETAFQKAEEVSHAMPNYQSPRTYALDSFWGHVAEWDDALGWIYFQEGRNEDAEHKLLAAEKIYGTDSKGQKRADGSPILLLHLGRYYTAQRDFDKAADYLSRSLSGEYYGEDEHPAIAAMKDLYLARNGNSNGLDAFMQTANEKEQARRRSQVLQSKIAEPKALQAFMLRAIDGSEVRSEKLKGKVLVINFWGTWCGPCKFELPAIQKFYDKYHGQNDVVFLTVDYNDDLKTVKQFMTDKKYTFPVLMESGYVDHSGVMGFPTTWFVGRDGKIAYEKVGASRRIVDEFTWRIEDLMKPASAAVSAQAQ